MQMRMEAILRGEEECVAAAEVTKAVQEVAREGVGFLVVDEAT